MFISGHLENNRCWHFEDISWNDNFTKPEMDGQKPTGRKKEAILAEGFLKERV